MPNESENLGSNGNHSKIGKSLRKKTGVPDCTIQTMHSGRVTGTSYIPALEDMSPRMALLGKRSPRCRTVVLAIRFIYTKEN